MRMKPGTTHLLIAALLVIVVAIPVALYTQENFFPDNSPTLGDYCGSAEFREVFGCVDGSFQTIRENYTEGFRIVMPDGSGFDCPFTLPQYQVGQCKDYTSGQCSGEDLCATEGACVSDKDCPLGSTCTDWRCS
jgi:hypothetical protein